MSKKSITIFYSDIFLDHNTGLNHPECAERLTSCVTALKKSDISDFINWKLPRSATLQDLEMIHTKSYIDSIKSKCEDGGGYLDTDTYVSSKSYKVALKSAGAWLDGIDEIIDGNSTFVLSRPPGHHAESNRAMGFCLFSNAALAATYSINRKDIKKIAIFDWDVHHGNGTQNIIESNPNIAYVSIHQFPFYPGTGNELEEGKYNNVLNIPMNAGDGSDEYRKKFNDMIFPFLKNFEPQLLIISAGFDAHHLDPLASINLKAKDFAYFTQRCLKIQPNLLFGLEGGYNLEALSKCVIYVTKQLV